MISKALIKGEHIFYEEDNLYNEYVAATDAIMNEVLHESVSKTLDNFFGDSYVSENSEEKQSFVQKIGKAIINVFNKFSKFIQGILDRIRGQSLKGKTDIQKLEKMVKKHPQFSSEITKAFQNGDLDLNAVKNLKDLDKTYEDILRLSKVKDVNPDTLKGKWEEAKKKYLSVEGIKNTASFVGSVITLATVVSKITKANSDLRSDQASMRKLTKETHDILEKEGTLTNNVRDNGFYTTMLTIHRELHGEHAKAAKKTSSSISRFFDRIASLADRIDKSTLKRGEKYYQNRNIELNRH